MPQSNLKLSGQKLASADLDKKKITYPERYQFFDDAYAKQHGYWINNASARKRLNFEARIAKIIFEYKKHYNTAYLLGDDFINIGVGDVEFYDIFAQINIASTVAKILIRLRNQEKAINYFNDIKILGSYFQDSNFVFRDIFKKYVDQKIFKNCFHPYIRLVLNGNDEYLLHAMASEEYKQAEAYFIRSANSERKRVNDFLSEKFIGNKNIFICRMDVLLQSAGSFKASERISLEEYRRNIGQFFEGLGLFDSALEMVFPSAVLEGNLRPSNSPVGQILLVSTEKVAANLKKLKEFAGQAKHRGLLDFVPTQPLAKGLVPSVDGLCQFTPATAEGIGWLAEFLTLERRFVAPGKTGDANAGSIHCMRDVKLKR